jgi:hypothetical protein
LVPLPGQLAATKSRHAVSSIVAAGAVGKAHADDWADALVGDNRAMMPPLFPTLK